MLSHLVLRRIEIYLGKYLIWILAALLTAKSQLKKVFVHLLTKYILM